jgi:hypothetical protein
MSLTPARKRVLDFVREYIAQNKYGPSYPEIGRALGLTSLATIHKHIHTLVFFGELEFKEETARGRGHNLAIPHAKDVQCPKCQHVFPGDRNRYNPPPEPATAEDACPREVSEALERLAQIGKKRVASQ